MKKTIACDRLGPPLGVSELLKRTLLEQVEALALLGLAVLGGRMRGRKNGRRRPTDAFIPLPPHA